MEKAMHSICIRQKEYFMVMRRISQTEAGIYWRTIPRCSIKTIAAILSRLDNRDKCSCLLFAVGLSKIGNQLMQVHRELSFKNWCRILVGYILNASCDIIYVNSIISLWTQ